MRLDRDRESAVTGTGLGLAVVRELVEAQGGRCWIEGAAGEGARVVVRLAKGAAPDDQGAGGRGPSRHRARAPGEPGARGLRGPGLGRRDRRDTGRGHLGAGLVLLDLMLPKRSGFDVLAAIRGRGADMPMMVVSARGGEAEKVRALRAGADDYVVKPFGLMEVVARVHALLRRVPGDRAGAGREEHYRLGNVTVDVPTRSVRRGAEPVVLRPKEFDLLVALCRARGAVVSRGELLNRVWGYGPVVTRTVDTHIAALRQRLEADADDPRLILTVWKAGYRVSPTADQKGGNLPERAVERKLVWATRLSRAAVFVVSMIVGLVAAQRAVPHVRTVDFVLLFASGVVFGVSLMGLYRILRGGAEQLGVRNGGGPSRGPGIIRGCSRRAGGQLTSAL